MDWSNSSAHLPYATDTSDEIVLMNNTGNYEHAISTVTITGSLIPSCSRIDGATLKVRFRSDSRWNGSRTVEVQRVLYDDIDSPSWLEYDTVGAQAWAVNGRTNSGQTGPPDTSGIADTVNITTDVDQWLIFDVYDMFVEQQGGVDWLTSDVTISFRFRCLTDRGILDHTRIRAGGGTAFRPLLYVTYTPNVSGGPDNEVCAGVSIFNSGELRSLEPTTHTQLADEMHVVKSTTTEHRHLMLHFKVAGSAIPSGSTIQSAWMNLFNETEIHDIETVQVKNASLGTPQNPTWDEIDSLAPTTSWNNVDLDNEAHSDLPDTGYFKGEKEINHWNTRYRWDMRDLLASPWDGNDHELSVLVRVKDRGSDPADITFSGPTDTSNPPRVYIRYGD